MYNIIKRLLINFIDLMNCARHYSNNRHLESLPKVWLVMILMGVSRVCQALPGLINPHNKICLRAQHVIDDEQGWRGTTDFHPAPLQQKESLVAKSGQVQKKPVWFLSRLTKSEVVQCLQYNVR